MGDPKHPSFGSNTIYSSLDASTRNKGLRAVGEVYREGIVHLASNLIAITQTAQRVLQKIGCTSDKLSEPFAHVTGARCPVVKPSHILAPFP